MERKNDDATDTTQVIKADAKTGAVVLAAQEADSGVEAPRMPKQKRATKKKATAKPRKPRRTTKASAGTTLADMADDYLAHLEADGASTSTVTGYRAELGRALKALGADTPLADLTNDAVRRFFRSKRVTTKRDGEKRDQKTIDRTRRVLRLALCFAEEQGLVEKAPVPEKV